MKNVKDFGAIGDGLTNDTAAIQRAIDAGGMVCLPPGTYLSGSLFLKSDGGLFLEAGATLLASPNLEDYRQPENCPHSWSSPLEFTLGRHFINAVGQRNVTLAGDGCINGNRQAFLYEMDPEIRIWFKRNTRPGQMLFFCNCENVNLRDLKLRESPYWHCHLFGCRNVQIRCLDIRGDFRAANNDGIDLDCCEDVTVSDCLIQTGDDCLAIRCDYDNLGRPQPCRRLAISNCVLESNYANAFRIGVGDGVVEQCLFSQCIIKDTRTGICIVTHYDEQSLGGKLRNLEFRQLHCECERLFNIKLDNIEGWQQTSQGCIEDMVFSDIRATVELTSQIIGNATGSVRNLSFQNLDLKFEGQGTAPNVNAEGGWGHSSTDAGFEISQAKNLRFFNCNIQFKDIPGWTTAIRADHPEEVSRTLCTSNRP